MRANLPGLLVCLPAPLVSLVSLAVTLLGLPGRVAGSVAVWRTRSWLSTTDCPTPSSSCSSCPPGGTCSPHTQSTLDTQSNILNTQLAVQSIYFQHFNLFPNTKPTKIMLILFRKKYKFFLSNFQTIFPIESPGKREKKSPSLLPITRRYLRPR